MKRGFAMPARPAAAGAVLHNGWAIVVSVTMRDDGPVVIDRRRLELADPELPSQPYHHEALDLDLAEGEALIRQVRKAVAERARQALHALRGDLAASSDLAALAFRESRPIPATLAAILGTQALYIADSEIYRDAMQIAVSELGLKVFSFRKSEEFEFAAQSMNTDARDLAERIRSWRKALGAPWQKDHHAAAAAAMGALARLSAVSKPPTVE
jgi:hypothetical protein